VTVPGRGWAFIGSSGQLTQSLDLLRRRLEGFSVMTGGDAYFYTTFAHGAAESWPRVTYGRSYS
jgi:hypothetical protein